MRLSLILLTGLLGTLLVGCKTAPVQLDTAAPYRQELARLKQQPTVKKGGVEEKAAIERVKGFLATMNEETVRQGTKTVYAADAYLNDTLTTKHGAAAIEAYFLETTKNAESITVVFEDVVESNGDYYFRWVMDTRLKKLRKGETIRTIGITHIRFNADGLVVLHQDYWDSAAGVYEHIPALGGMIRWVKAKF
jgi:limonene-1,2-epoxide hydrolase